MFFRLAFVAAAASAASMCATSPQAEDPEPQGQPGPDGLILRPAPSTGVEAGSLPSPAASEADEAESS